MRQCHENTLHWMFRWLRPTRTICALATVAVIAGCSPQTVVYHEVPEWQIREGLVPDEYVDEQGVLHVYKAREWGAQDVDPATEDVALGNTAEVSNKDEEFHALMPEQVLARLLRALADEEYEFLWDKVLANETRKNYEDHGGGFKGFEQFMTKNRDDLFAAFNRMSIEVRSPAVVHEQGRDGSQRIRFHRHYADQFRFGAIDLVWEDNGLKLLMIHPTHEAQATNR